MSLFIKNAAVAIAELDNGEADVMMGPVIGEAVIVNEEEATMYATLIELEGIPTFYVSERSILACFTQEGDNAWVKEYLKKNALPLADYEDIYSNEELEGTELYMILLYLTYIVRCPSGEEEGFINETMGKKLDEIEIPTTDVEEEYWTMREAMEAEEEALENAPLIEVSAQMSEFFALLRHVHRLNESEKARYLELIEILG